MPFLVNGETVWAAQTRNAVGRLYDIGEYFLGIRMDPNADEGRNYLMQDLLYSQSIISFGWSQSGLKVPKEEPRSDFTGNVWFSDGYRMVVWVSGEPYSIGDIDNLRWDQHIRGKELSSR